MAYKITWTKKALTSFETITNYLEKEYGETTTKEFAQKVYHTLDLLAEFPQMGSIEVQSKQIRGFLITKQTRLFYRLQVKIENITLLNFFDNSQDSSKKL
jgi:plasmid stabilization system protein ParE